MNKLEQDVGTGSDSVIRKTARRPYKKPELTIYGKIAELTAGETGSVPDAGHTTPTRRR